MSGEGVSGATRGQYTSHRSRPYRRTLTFRRENKQTNKSSPSYTCSSPRLDAARALHGEQKMVARRAEWRAVVNPTRRPIPVVVSRPTVRIRIDRSLIT